MYNKVRDEDLIVGKQYLYEPPSGGDKIIMYPVIITEGRCFDFITNDFISTSLPLSYAAGSFYEQVDDPVDSREINRQKMLNRLNVLLSEMIYDSGGKLDAHDVLGHLTDLVQLLINNLEREQ